MQLRKYLAKLLTEKKLTLDMAACANSWAAELEKLYPKKKGKEKNEGIEQDKITAACEQIKEETGLPAFDVLKYGSEPLINLLKTYLK